MDIDDLHQYTRRNCFLVYGLKDIPEPNSNANPADNEKDFEKYIVK